MGGIKDYRAFKSELIKKTIMIPQRKKRIREGIRLKTVEIGLVFNTLTF